MSRNPYSYKRIANDEYTKVTRSGAWWRLWARLTGKDYHLLPFEDVKTRLRSSGQRYYGLQPVPLDKIIGSFGRSHDFDRVFRPTQRHSKSKWISVDSALLSGINLPPVSLYKIGDAYFVVDGHHRVSVARQKGQAFIDAHVVEVQSRVPVTADLTLEDLDILSAYQDFLEKTKLDRLRPDQDLRLSMPGDYEKLLEHIHVHKYFVETEQKRELTWEEAVTHWYDHVYMPVIEVIRKNNLLQSFPGLTEADLYFGIIEHTYFMSQEAGRSLAPWEVAQDFVLRFGKSPKHLLMRLGRYLRHLLIPDHLEAGPPAGTWRAERVPGSEGQCIFRDILVTITGAPSSWLALSQAAEVARRENSILRGLHVIPSDTPEALERGRHLLEEFDERAKELGIPATSRLVQGDIADKIIEQSRWADIVVINQRRVHGRLDQLPLGSIFESVASRVARPILAVPGNRITSLQRVLLAYDGSPKANEALFVFGHILSCWQARGYLVTVEGPGITKETMETANRYIDETCQQKVESFFETGTPHEAILRIMGERDIELLLMGSFGHQPLLKAFLGSTIDRILRVAWFPVLICR